MEASVIASLHGKCCRSTVSSISVEAYQTAPQQ